MNLSPLFNASFAIQLHVAAAVVAIAAVIPLAIYRKGNAAHRRLGWIVMIGLAVLAVSSFWIRELNHGSFSWIHILSVLTLTGLARGLYAIRTGNRRAHLQAMSFTAVTGLVFAGGFTFLPGRMMWRVLFG